MMPRKAAQHPVASNHALGPLLLLALAARTAAAQTCLDLPVVGNFAELQQVVDTAWVGRMTAALYPPGMSFTNSVHLLAYAPAGFDPTFLAGLKADTAIADLPLLSGVVRESSTAPLARSWFGAGAAPVASTPLPAGYDPVQWVLSLFPPPAGVAGEALEQFIADRRLSRQAIAFTLISTNDVPAYTEEMASRRAAAPPNIGEKDIGVVQIHYVPALDVVDLLVRAPPEVDYLGVYATTNIAPPVAWTSLGNVAHFTDPMPWTFAPTGPRHYLLLANHVLDSDLDGIPDAVEQLTTGTDSALADSDGDGLSDYDG